MSGRIKRFVRQQKTVLYAARWSIASLRNHFFQAVWFGVLILLLASGTLAVFLETAVELNYLDKILVTLRMLLLSAADAVTFDLLTIAGLDFKPAYPSILARMIMYGFYSLLALIVGRAILMTMADVWTILVCAVFPQPSLRTANLATKLRTLTENYVPNFKRERIRDTVASWNFPSRIIFHVTTLGDLAV